MTEIFGIPLPALLGQLLLGLVNGSFYAMLSLGLAVIFGMLNIINFAHGALFMMGAFVSWMLLNYVGIGGGASGTHPADLLEFVRRTPDGAVLTIESIMRSVIGSCSSRSSDNPTSCSPRPGSHSFSGGMLLSAIGPWVSSTQFTATSRTW